MFALRFNRDTAQRLKRVSHAKGTATPFADFDYTLDPVGNVRDVTQVQPTPPMLLPDERSQTYGLGNQLETVNGVAVTHDANGNLSAGPILSAPVSSTLSYDFEDRLVSAQTGSTTSATAYDGLGRRLSLTQTTTAGTTTTRFLLDTSRSLTHILAETDASGNPIVYYIYGVTLLSRMPAAGSVSYYHADRTGSTIALTNAAGVVTDSYAHDPFGVPAGAQGTTPNPFRFLGTYGIYDNRDGMLFVRARHYVPAMGRFSSRDPLLGSDANPQTLNRYAYALNNPLRLIDPSGLAARETTVASMSSSIPSYIPSSHANSTPMISNALLELWNYMHNFPGVPRYPDGVDIDANIVEARRHRRDLIWFYFKNRNKSDWDYKQLEKVDGEYENFGNFHYGVVGRAAGIPEWLLLRVAGLAQQQASTSDSSFGVWYGSAPYGDDFNDQKWIKEGFMYYDAFKR